MALYYAAVAASSVRTPRANSLVDDSAARNLSLRNRAASCGWNRSLHEKMSTAA